MTLKSEDINKLIHTIGDLPHGREYLKETHTVFNEHKEMQAAIKLLRNLIDLSNEMNLELSEENVRLKKEIDKLKELNHELFEKIILLTRRIDE